MAYLKWFALLIPSYAMAIIGRLIAPILPLFVQEDGYLPKYLSWFQTPFDACDGDEDHMNKWPGSDWWSTYKRRLAWFLRNVAYGFDMRVLGVEVKPYSDVIETIGNPDVSDQNGISGLCRWRVYRQGKLVAWQWYFIYHYQIFGSLRCIRIGAGWKVWSIEKLYTEPAQYFSVLNPFKSAFDQ